MDKIFVTQDGSHSVFSEQFGVSYHSKYGAIQETQHVFIDAALRYKAVVKKDLKILDIGFGTGLNALMTLTESEKRNLNIVYHGVEAFPLNEEQIYQLNYTEELKLKERYAEAFQKMHDLEWGEAHQLLEKFEFTKHLCTFQEIDFKDYFDIIYFDAFAPNAQPELWEADLMQKMYDALQMEGVLVTYCAKGVVKRTLKEVGFEIEKLKGPPGKREMTRASKLS